MTPHATACQRRRHDRDPRPDRGRPSSAPAASGRWPGSAAEVRLQRLPRTFQPPCADTAADAATTAVSITRADDERQRARGSRRRSPSAPTASRAVRDVVDAATGPTPTWSASARHHVRADPRQRHERRRQLDDVLHFLAARDLAALPRRRGVVCCGFFCCRVLGHRRLSGAPPRRARPAGRPASATCAITSGTTARSGAEHGEAGEEPHRRGVTIRFSCGAARDSSPSATSTTNSTSTTGAAMRMPMTKTVPSVRATSGASSPVAAQPPAPIGSAA